MHNFLQYIFDFLKMHACMNYASFTEMVTNVLCNISYMGSMYINNIIEGDHELYTYIYAHTIPWYPQSSLISVC